jgi:hypothetical protein
LRFLIDPGVNGTLTQRDDGTEVRRFDAPKARLMSLITDGILRGNLPWGFVLIGVSIALVLELCGVSSLAFAVGVYLPLSASTPIFVGGLARYVADNWGRRDTAGKTPEQIEAEAETSPGSLLSTGYIAGGAIAGVLIAFLSFSDDIPRWLAFWQYRTSEVSISQGEMPLDDAIESATLRELGYTKDEIEIPTAIKEKQEAGKALTPAEKAMVDAVKKRKDAVEAMSDDILDLNRDLKPRFTKVPKDFTVKLPRGQEYKAAGDTTLGKVAAEQLGSESKASLLFDLNLDTLIEVPAGKVLTLPDSENGKKPARKAPHPASVASLTGLLAAPCEQGPWSGAASAFPDSMFLGKDVQVYVNPTDAKLGEVAKRAIPRSQRAPELLPLGNALGPLGVEALDTSASGSELYELNKKELEPPVMLPAGTKLKLPQHVWPAIVAFGLLTLLLVLVGMGYLFRVPSNGTK